MSVVPFRRRPPEMKRVPVTVCGEAAFSLMSCCKEGGTPFTDNTLAVKFKDKDTGGEQIMIFEASKRSANTFRQFADVLDALPD